jgi:hypothetical protein
MPMNFDYEVSLFIPAIKCKIQDMSKYFYCLFQTQDKNSLTTKSTYASMKQILSHGSLMTMYSMMLCSN